jgi:DNA-binding protein HU-beta
MNKSELVSALAHKTNQTQVEAKAFLEAFTDIVSETLKSGDKLTLVGFGTFDVQDVAARTGRNPRTGEAIQIKGKKKPRFKAGTDLNSFVN